MLTAKVRVFSDAVFCTCPGALDPNSASKFWEQTAEHVRISDDRKNGNDIAGRSTDIDWHVCVLVTHQCKDCTSFNNSCRRQART